MSNLTLSGWAAITSAGDTRMRWIAIPGTTQKILVREEVAPVFAAALSMVHKNVINLNPGPIAGWNYRKARAAAGWSNHAGGVAVDFRWDVWTAEHKQFASPHQILAMHAILEHFKTSRGKRVFGWGGDWGKGYTDDMHLEVGQAWQPGVNSFVSAADFADVQKRLRIDNNGVTAKQVVIPKKPMVLKTPPFPGDFKQGAHGPFVLALQRGLIGGGAKLVADGNFGPQTTAAVKSRQRRRPKFGKPTGVVGAFMYSTVAVGI